MNELMEKIAGEITLSESPGSTMKKWRELFGITQMDLAKQIKISTSTVSDYESNRRMSPGVGVIKRFVDALFLIDKERGGTVVSGLAQAVHQERGEGPVLQDTRLRRPDKRRRLQQDNRGEGGR